MSKNVNVGGSSTAHGSLHMHPIRKRRSLMARVMDAGVAARLAKEIPSWEEYRSDASRFKSTSPPDVMTS